MRSILRKCASSNYSTRRAGVREAWSLNDYLPKDVGKKFIYAVNRTANYAFNKVKEGVSKFTDRQVTDWLDDNIWRPLFVDVKNLAVGAASGITAWFANKFLGGGQNRA